MILRLLFIFLISSAAFGQDTIIIDGSGNNLNTSIANRFTLKEFSNGDSYTPISVRKLSNSVENLDFTANFFTIDFVLVNTTPDDKELFLECARPITNVVNLSDYSEEKTYYSGDAIPFNTKTIKSNRSILPVSVKANSSKHFQLLLRSDGEIISLPMIFWEHDQFQLQERKQQFTFGIFYGIFLFVIIIYATFYVLLRDRLFLLYTIYVIFSGLLQFALDGYIHQYIFTSGGFLTQHSVVFISGLTVFIALLYASAYLKLKGRYRLVSRIFAGLVALITLLSLIEGRLYEISFPLINGFSFLVLLFLFIAGVHARRKDPSISILFLIGLFTLISGAVIFILGNFSIIDLPGLTQNALKAGTLAEIICLSILMAGKYKILQEEKEAAQKQLLVELEEKNRIVSETNIRLEQEVKERTKEIEAQRLELKEKNDDLISSIRYAERIQNAILPHREKFKALLPDSFVFYQPKDIVSGDFYWVERIEPTSQWSNGLVVYATADCTGHGVPGAFVSILCSNLLKIGKTDKDVQTTGQVLDFVNREINATLNSEYSNDEIRDGMDVALCALDIKGKKLYFSGAKNGIYILRGMEIIEYKGDRKAIGNSGSGLSDTFNTEEIALQEGDIIYSFSDGIVDQFGGPKQKKFMSRRLKELLLEIGALPMHEQQERIKSAFETWKGALEQVDDVLMIGVRI